MSTSNETLPLPTPGSVSVASSTDTILAQFYRVAPVSTNNIDLAIIDSNAKVYLPSNSFNNTMGPTGVTFPDANSIRIVTAGTYTHNISIYLSSDVTGIIGVDIVDAAGMQCSDAAFSLKDSSTTSVEPLILIAVVNHSAGDIIKLRFGGASEGNLGIIASIWSIMWNLKM